MTKKAIEKISSAIIHAEICPKSQREILLYGLRKIVNYIQQVLLLAIIALPLGLGLHVLLFTMFYCPLRTKVGGAHSNSHIGCLTVYTVISVLSAVLSCAVPIQPVLPAMVSVLSAVIVFLRAPVVHPNAPKRETALRKCRRQGRVIVCLECIAICISSILVPETVLPYILCASLGMGTVSIFLLIPIFKREEGKK